MSIADDRKRGQVLTGAKQLAFNDPEMQRIITTGFTIPRCTVAANRLIARASDVQRKYDDRKNKTDKMSDEDTAIVEEGRKAKELLFLIDKPIN